MIELETRTGSGAKASFAHLRVKHRVDICFCRWKGENVATTEVADILMMVDCIEEANAYGVEVEGDVFEI